MQKIYDYVIVGAGSAGCVLAARLSENPGVRVLLVEAGGVDRNPLISIPLGMGLMHKHHMHDWGLSSEPEAQLDNRRIELMAGKVLGGSSSINVMAYTRGNPGDFDRWAANGAPGWSYADVLPWFKSCERWEDGESDTRGGSGLLGTQWARTPDPIFPAWIEAGKQAGFPHTPDYNSGNQEGFGRGQYTIFEGRRASAARAFLKPARGRKNLDVTTGATVLGIDLEGRRASAVRYSVDGRTTSVRAGREILLCAGAYNSPRLLMLSGIGPADHLAEMGIETRVDLPVGHDLQDHLGTWITWTRRAPGTFHREMRFDRMAASMVRAFLTGTGPGTIVPGGLHAFVKTRPDVAVPDVEFMFHTVPKQARLWIPGVRPAYEDAYAIRPTLMHPKSRGRLLLRSADPRDKPRIVYNFLSDPDDLPVLREAFKRARDVGNQPALAPYRAREATPGDGVQSDAEIDAYLRATCMTAHHPAATCRMGSDDTAVVDTQFRVRGVDNLRVVDASAMPDLITGHINACVLMMAERAADFIQSGAMTGGPAVTPRAADALAS